MTFLDKLTDAIRARWTGRRSDAGDEVDPATNRGTLRKARFQGRQGLRAFKDGMLQGRRRGSFLDAGAMPSILIPHTPARRKISRQTARSRREKQRARARGEI